MLQSELRNAAAETMVTKHSAGLTKVLLTLGPRFYSRLVRLLAMQGRRKAQSIVRFK